MSDQAGNTNATRGRFLWGALLAWIPFLIIVVPWLHEMFRGISNQKATGLGAVAGGLSEAFVTFGVIAFVAVEISAIVLLIRSMGVGGTVRTLFAILSIGLSVLMLVATGLLLWMMWYVIPRMRAG